MKVLLIQPSVGDFYKGTKVEVAIEREAPLNLAVLAGSLEQAGHQVRILDLGVEANEGQAMARAIQTFEPDWCGLTFRTPLYEAAKKIADQIKGINDQVRIVAGGVHATNYPEGVLRDTRIDVVLMGEADFSLVDLVGGMAYEAIADIAYRENGRIRLNRLPKVEGRKARGYLEDLDVLPIPAYHLYEVDRYRNVSSLLHRRQPVGFIETSRGCLAACVFCTKGVFGRTFRVKSPKRVVDEMQYLLDCGFEEINIADDSFTTYTERAIAVCDEILARKMHFPWSCTNGLRVSDVNEEFFRKASQAGLHLIAYGFETGNKQVLINIKKGATLDKAVLASQWAKRYGIKVLGYFMLGLPGETEQSMQDTIDFACRLDIDYAKFAITIPLPGTELYYMWKDRIKVDNWLGYNFHSVARDLYDHPDLDWDVIEHYVKKSYRQYYWRPSYLLRRLVNSFAEGKLLLEVRTALAMRW